MRKSFLTALFLFVSIISFAGDPDAGISNELMHERIPGRRYKSIRDIDFANSPLDAVLCDKPIPRCWPPLRNGSFEKEWKETGDGYEGIELKKVDYVRGATGNEWAVVRYSGIMIGGSSSPYGGVKVIGLDSDGYPVINQEITYNTRNADPDETWARFSRLKERLVISATHSWEHCCPKDRIIITFDWNGDKFVPVGRKVKPLRRPS